MTKRKFLKRLEGQLHAIEKQERKKYISDYDELISDLVENGMSEADAIAKQGSPESIAKEILNGVEPGRLKKRDVPGIIIRVITILLFIASLVCILLFPGIATVGVVDASGSSAFFFAGKLSEPFALYIVTLLFFVLDIVYTCVRKRKKSLIVLLVMTALLVVMLIVRKPIRTLIFGHEKEVQTMEMSAEERTIQILDLLNAGDYDTLCNQYTAKEMLPYMTKDCMETAKNNISDDWGSFVSYGKVYTSEVNQNGITYVVSQVSVSYEHVSVIYTITYDEEDKIAGLYMK